MFAGRTAQERWKLALDWGLALALVLASVWLLLASSDRVGYTRDETFYFNHSRTYTNWFTALAQAPDSKSRDKLLSNEGIEKYWLANWEHPPLAKVAIGASWRLLGQKVRPLKVDPKGRTASVLELGPSHGFQPGARVKLLAPLPVGASPEEAQVLGHASVSKRGDAQARLKLEGASKAAVLAACAQPPKPPAAMGPCQAVEDAPNLLLSEAQAYRFPGMLAFGLLLGLLFFLARLWLRRLPALVGVLAFATIPQVFFHGHLACFDVPITTLNLATIMAFLWAERRGGVAWALLAGVLWGLALLTKNNAFFVPVVLGLYFLATWAWRPKTWGLGPLRLPSIPLPFFTMVVLGPALLYLGWPLLWHDPVHHFSKYLLFHLKHEHYLQYYFGQALQSAPFPVEYPFVLTALMTPIPTLLLAGAGLAVLLPVARRRWAEALGQVPTPKELVFLALNGAFPIVLIALPSTPIFGGLKHWLLTLVFLGLLAGFGFSFLALGLCRAVEACRGGRSRLAVLQLWAAVLAVLILAPAFRDTARFVSFGTSYWNELAGGLRGSADLKLQRQFWSYSFRQVLDFVNRNAAPGATVDFQDATQETCRAYQRHQLLRQDLRCVIRKPSADWFLFDVDERFREEEHKRSQDLGAPGPVFEASLEGVPLMRVYRRAPQPPAPPPQTRGEP